MCGVSRSPKDGVEINENAMTLATELPYAIQETEQKQGSSEPYMPLLVQAPCQDPPTRMHLATFQIPLRPKQAALCYPRSNDYPW